MISEDLDLRDVVAFSYGDSTQCDIQNGQGGFLGNVDPFYSSDVKIEAGEKGPRNTITV